MFTLATIIFTGAFYVYPNRNKKVEDYPGFTQQDSYKLDYYLDANKFSYTVNEKPTQKIKRLMISNAEGKNFSFDIYRYPEDNVKLFFQPWVEQKIDSENIKYIPPQECKYFVIRVNVSKYYPFSQLDHIQNSNPDFTMRNAVEYFNCESADPNNIELSNIVI